MLFDWIWSYSFICSRILMSIETVGCVMPLKQGRFKPKENSLSISFHFDCWWICGLIGRDDMKTFRTVQRLQTQNNRWIYKAISIPLRFQCKICTSTVFSYGLTKLFQFLWHYFSVLFVCNSCLLECYFWSVIVFIDWKAHARVNYHVVSMEQSTYIAWPISSIFGTKWREFLMFLLWRTETPQFWNGFYFYSAKDQNIST